MAAEPLREPRSQRQNLDIQARNQWNLGWRHVSLEEIRKNHQAIHGLQEDRLQVVNGPRQ